jgi:hypothetical protein
MPAWRRDEHEGQSYALIITPAGRAAINIEPDEARTDAGRNNGGKKAPAKTAPRAGASKRKRASDTVTGRTPTSNRFAVSASGDVRLRRRHLRIGLRKSELPPRWNLRLRAIPCRAPCRGFRFPTIRASHHPLDYLALCRDCCVKRIGDNCGACDAILQKSSGVAFRSLNDRERAPARGARRVLDRRGAITMTPDARPLCAASRSRHVKRALARLLRRSAPWDWKASSRRSSARAITSGRCDAWRSRTPRRQRSGAAPKRIGAGCGAQHGRGANCSEKAGRPLEARRSDDGELCRCAPARLPSCHPAFRNALAARAHRDRR